MPLLVVPRRDRKLNRLVKAADTVDARRGEIVWRGGDPATDVVLVRGGHLRLEEPLLAGRDGRCTVAVAGPWEMAGEEAVLPDAHRLQTAVAGESLRFQRLDAAGVATVLRTSPATFGAFTTAQLADLRLARRLASGSGGPEAAARVAAVLLDLVDRLGEPAGKGALRLAIRPTHRTLGDLSGAHRSTVTTLLNAWLYEDVVGGKGREIVVRRRDRLEALARNVVPARATLTIPGVSP